VGGEVALRGRHAGQRRLGSPAWLERDGDAWRPRPGRPKPGWLTERREDEPARLEVFTVEQVEALARAAENGSWRTGPPYETLALDEFRRAEDGQLGDLLRIAAYTGLRRGELVALRWRDVRWSERVLVVERALSDNVERTTKGRRIGYVPLADQAIGALDRLSQRPHFVGSDDYVFASVAGDRLDPSALRRSARRGRAAAAAASRPAPHGRHAPDAGARPRHGQGRARARRPQDDRALSACDPRVAARRRGDARVLRGTCG
jgi:integrase